MTVNDKIPKRAVSFFCTFSVKNSINRSVFDKALQDAFLRNAMPFVIFFSHAAKYVRQ